jgi:AcrR family transcriptional regulator
MSIQSVKRGPTQVSIREQHLLATRRAILSALGDQIAESGTMGFTIRDVAERAGVTQRTVYNHFPTREELSNAFAAHVEELIGSELGAPPEEGIRVAGLPGVVRDFYPILEAHEAPLRAYAMLTVATRAPAQVATDRSRRFEALLEDELGPLPDGQAHAIVAAIRMFLSTTGWHLLTEHHGLSHGDAARTASWATRVLLEAVSRGDRPDLEPSDEIDDGG